MTLNEIAYDLAETVGKETDYGFVNRMKFHVNQYRALFFRRDQSRGNRLPQSFIQSLGCIDTIEVPSTECCGVDLGCYVYRTKTRVPKPIRLPSSNAFTYVGTIDGQNAYSQSTKQEAEYRSFDRFRAKSAYFVYENGYIYIFNAYPEKLLVKGVFEDPKETARLNLCDEECYSDDKEYPLPSDMAPGIITSITKEVLFQGPATDEENPNVDVDDK